MKKLYDFVCAAAIITVLFAACKKKDPEVPATTPDPVANFSFTQGDGLAPVEVVFTNTSQNADSCAWDFGNGQTSTETNPHVTYAVGGNYTITLTAKKGTKSNSKSVVLTLGNPPAPGFTIEKLTQYAPMRVKLNNTSQNADSYTWDLGYKSQTSTEVSPEFEYPASGTFTITLKAKKGTREVTASQTLIVGKDPAMIAHYPFENSTIDFSDKGNDAQLRYLANYGEGRKTGERALNLGLMDYKNNVRPSAEMPAGLLKNTGTATSISLWFYQNEAGKGCLLSCQDVNLYGTAGLTQYVPIAYIYQNTLYVKLWNGSVEPIIKKVDVPANTWHHLVIAGDATDIRAYLDGVMIGSIPGPVNYLNMAYNYIGAGYLTLGGPWPGSPIDINDYEEFHFYGRIDDVRVYKKKVSEAEVKALYME